MKKTLLALATALGLGAALPAEASHMAGAYLTYTNISPNVYHVEYKLVRDCTGISPGQTQTLSFQAPGCSGATPGQVTLQLSSTTPSTQYASGVQTTCAIGNQSNLWDYSITTYTGTVTLPASCPEWIMSVRVGNRNASANISNGPSQWHYVEAMINNASATANNSP
ncbi:MAG: hypothetical protein LPK19_13465, partial [Hymenobacteraceae bacterium]|nr:hypothetical protein [Hymenobacteraceae bacterium]MDX5397236.1 hypothetical protein [Hymenobacteraceae bacterium]MDX5513312.1 hypothetical protein [Hymenobacteraceae bacterium]